MRLCILADASQNRTSRRTRFLPKFRRWSRVLRERKLGLMLGVFDDASSNIQVTIYRQTLGTLRMIARGWCGRNRSVPTLR